jgi:hypothetical protein
MDVRWPGSLDFINFPRRFTPGSEIKSDKTTMRRERGKAISRRDSRSFHSNGPWTIIEQDLDERIAPGARRQTSGIRSHVAGSALFLSPSP